MVALGLLYGLGGAVTAVLGEPIHALTFPNGDYPVISLVSAAVQAALIGVLAFRRIREPEQSNLQA